MSSILIPIVFLLSISLYLKTLAPSVNPQGDSGELITVAYTLGIAHPPGYPLFTLFGRLFSLVPLGSIAWRINLMSAVFHSLTLVFVFLILKNVTRNALVSFFTALILGLSYTFWLYSLVAEVFPLNDLLAVVLIYLVFLIRGSKINPRSEKLFILLAFLTGLSLTNHQTIILIFPALFYLLFPILRSIRKKILLIALISFLIALTLYLYFPIRSRIGLLPVIWRPVLSLSDLLKFFLRSDYGSLNPYAGSLPAMATLGQKWLQLVNYSRFLLDDFQPWGILLALFGIGYGLKHYCRFLTFVLICLGSIAFFLSYANFPIQDFSGITLSVIERFYLLPNIFVALLIGLGLSGLYMIVQKRLFGRILVLGLMFIYLISLFLTNYHLADQSENYLDRDLGRNILSGLAPGSLIFPKGDVATFAVLYVRYVENYRRDVQIITDNLVTSHYQFLRSQLPSLNLSPNDSATVGAIIAQNYQQIKSYVSGFPGFELDSLTASPSGFNYEFYPSQSLPSISEWQQKNQQVLSTYVLPTQSDLVNRRTIGDQIIFWHYSNMYLFLADICRNNQLYSCSNDYYQKASQLNPNDAVIKYRIADNYYRQGDCQSAQNWYHQVLIDNPANLAVISNLIVINRDCLKNQSEARKYQDLYDRYLNQEYSLKKL